MEGKKFYLHIGCYIDVSKGTEIFVLIALHFGDIKEKKREGALESGPHQWITG